MKIRQDVIEFCLSLDDTYEDYPFHDFNWTIMRHKGNQKMFAAIYEHLGNIWVNVKCDPNLAKLGYTNVKEFGGIIDWPYEVEK